MPSDLALPPDGRVLVTDYENDRIRMLSADLQQVSTLAGSSILARRTPSRLPSPAGFQFPVLCLPCSRVPSPVRD